MGIDWKTAAVSIGVSLAIVYAYHHYVMKKTVVPAALVPAA